MSQILVQKRSGATEPYRADMINNAIERAAAGLSDIPNKVMRIISDFELTLFSGITTRDLDKSLIIAASQNIKDDPDYDHIARNLLLLTIYKECMEGYEADADLTQWQQDYFPRYIKLAVEIEMLDKAMATKFDLTKLAAALVPERDQLFKYLGLSTLHDRYLLRDRNQKLTETPQAFWMRVAMGLSLNESDPTASALRFYHHMSQLEYLHATPTLFNSGTTHPQLSSCYILNMYDDIDNIGKTVSDTMQLAKYAGGIGVSVTNIRAIGSYIRSINGKSSGVIPFLKVLDVTIKGITQGGKRRGSICFYMENWHYEFDEFMELRENSGDPYRRTYASNIAAWISDEFMRRVENDEMWYLFDPAEVSDLPELFGQSFSKRYNEYVQMATTGKLKMFKKISAREQLKEILIRLQSTSHPWITFKDAMNVRALTQNVGVIHSSNLCTEIALPNDRDNIAVCNLASINLSRFVDGDKIDFTRMEKAVRSAVAGLDNVIDINLYPVPETKNSNGKNRPVGLGLMGFTETIEKLRIPYDSPKATRLMDEVMEFISYLAIDESCNLAQTKGSYANFKGSGWSKGMVPIDTLAILEEERGQTLNVNKSSKLDWDKLRAKVKQGIRNADLLAIAPNATIGLIAGTTPGLDPNFSNIFSRNTLSGKFIEVNQNLVEDLKKVNLWDQLKDKIVENRGTITDIADIPHELKSLYKTSFEINADAYTDIAAAAQKWVDQAISRNIYLETRELSNMMAVYQNAWRKGLKSTYYLHMKQRHTAEQSTSTVNKRESMGRKGFGGFKIASTSQSDVHSSINASTTITQDSTATTFVNLTTTDSSTVETKPGTACPVDPQERLNCESCQ